jgi:hypothetical protein
VSDPTRNPSHYDSQLLVHRRYFCPGAIFAYIDALKCDEEIGLYCPAGSKTNTTGCKAGFYCPTPDQQLVRLTLGLRSG